MVSDMRLEVRKALLDCTQILLVGSFALLAVHRIGEGTGEGYGNAVFYLFVVGILVVGWMRTTKRDGDSFYAGDRARGFAIMRFVCTLWWAMHVQTRFGAPLAASAALLSALLNLPVVIDRKKHG